MRKTNIICNKLRKETANLKNLVERKERKIGELESKINNQNQKIIKLANIIDHNFQTMNLTLSEYKSVTHEMAKIVSDNYNENTNKIDAQNQNIIKLMQRTDKNLDRIEILEDNQEGICENIGKIVNEINYLFIDDE